MTELNAEMFNKEFNYKNLSVNDYLAKGEKILWHQKPKAKSYVVSNVLSLTPFALIWLLFDSCFIVGITLAGSIPFFAIIILVVFFILHLTPVWIWIGGMVKAYKEIKNTEYYITNKRIIVTNFPNKIEIKEMNISEIKHVNLKKTGIDKMVKVGDVEILSEDKSIILYDIKEPEKIYTIFDKIKNKFENLGNLPICKICEYCSSKIKDDENKCSSCGATYLEK